MAHKKGQGSSRNGRESASQRLGLKATHGQTVSAGSILIRQRGTKWNPGENVKRAKDDSLFALCDGTVSFKKVTRRTKSKTYVEILPLSVEVG